MYHRRVWRKFHEINKNEERIYKTLWKAAKVVLTGKLISVYAYIKKEENQKLITQHYTLRNLK